MKHFKEIINVSMKKSAAVHRVYVNMLLFNNV